MHCTGGVTKRRWNLGHYDEKSSLSLNIYTPPPLYDKKIIQIFGDEIANFFLVSTRIKIFSKSFSCYYEQTEIPPLSLLLMSDLSNICVAIWEKVHKSWKTILYYIAKKLKLAPFKVFCTLNFKFLYFSQFFAFSLFFYFIFFAKCLWKCPLFPLEIPYTSFFFFDFVYLFSDC